MLRAWIALLFASLSGTAAAEAPRLSLPVDCTPGRTCWVVNYVDHDPGPGARDYHCGGLTYDGHKGTDIALRDLQEMASGVAVLAAAPGVVRGMRDGMPDRSIRDGSAEAIAGRECGNGVVIAHEGGLETQYCHMRQGSVAVKPGEVVSRGQRLGLVGLSGQTEFPHVHLSVRQGGAVIDPFLGAEAPGACRPGTEQLWTPDAASALAYVPTAIYNAGFSAGPPDPADLRAGRRDKPPTADAPALVLWADMFGVEGGDRITLKIIGPDGATVVENTRTMDRRQARRFEYAGRKRPGSAWPAGLYRGEIAVARGDTVTRREARIEIR